jgi:hypothetical protein
MGISATTCNQLSYNVQIEVSDSKGSSVNFRKMDVRFRFHEPENDSP